VFSVCLLASRHTGSHKIANTLKLRRISPSVPPLSPAPRPRPASRGIDDAHHAHHGKPTCRTACRAEYTRGVDARRIVTPAAERGARAGGECRGLDHHHHHHRTCTTALGADRSRASSSRWGGGGVREAGSWGRPWGRPWKQDSRGGAEGRVAGGGERPTSLGLGEGLASPTLSSYAQGSWEGIEGS
jgi:hypothetical protein